jgi:hypothetical protein
VANPVTKQTTATKQTPASLPRQHDPAVFISWQANSGTGQGVLTGPVEPSVVVRSIDLGDLLVDDSMASDSTIKVKKKGPKCYCCRMHEHFLNDCTIELCDICQLVGHDLKIALFVMLRSLRCQCIVFVMTS